jgi:AAA domain
MTADQLCGRGVPVEPHAERCSRCEFMGTGVPECRWPKVNGNGHRPAPTVVDGQADDDPDGWPEGATPLRPPGGSGQPSGELPDRIVSLVRASSIKIQRAEWVWETSKPGTPITEQHGRIPRGMLTIAAGPAGLGKSTFGLWLAANITKGTLPGCWHGQPKGVIYCTTEDSWELTVVPRLIAAGADLQHVYRADVTDARDDYARLSLPTDVFQIEALIERHQVGLIITDPLLSMFDGDIDENKQTHVRRALEPMVGIANRTGCAVLGIAHFTKRAGPDPLLAITGSGAFGQTVRCALAFARRTGAAEDEPPFIVSQAKNNVGREDLPSFLYRLTPCTVEAEDGGLTAVAKFTLCEETGDNVREYIGDDYGAKRTAREICAELIIGICRKHYQPGQEEIRIPGAEAEEDAQRSEVAPRTMRRAATDLGRLRTEKIGDTWWWTFPASVLDDGARARGQKGEGDSKRTRASDVPLSPSQVDGGSQGDMSACPPNGGDPEPATRANTESHEIRSADTGPCARCGTPCHRYGDGGRTLCEACQDNRPTPRLMPPRKDRTP